ncbi:hypothetical protein GCM10023322_36000 [Rugosimonospora acidiphila]|uniref:MftR C-terminal domain-containing protein n=1 Tax=Rugosimonospora acidiphila TaxID=556531 RepID=A0ABP9RWV5_9ACTN
MQLRDAAGERIRAGARVGERDLGRRYRREARHAVVSAALACLNNAVDEWARTRGTKPVDKLPDLAIAAVRG